MTMERYNFVIIGLLLVMVSLSVLRMVMLVDHSADGFYLNTLQIKLKETELKNKILKQELITAQSYQVIAKRAEALGFVQDTNFVYVDGR